MKKVELLSPVGNFNTLLACINAGCDAVYLSGNRFGARAYADNFDENELLEAIKAAHLFDVSVYLTVNTIIKEKETNEVIDFINDGGQGSIYSSTNRKVLKMMKENAGWFTGYVNYPSVLKD